MIFRHLLNMRSHPTWVRGLKQQVHPQSLLQISVAPYVGAWIETLACCAYIIFNMSHPTWVRGLKPIIPLWARLYKKSHPTWVRGLKL